MVGEGVAKEEFLPTFHSNCMGSTSGAEQSQRRLRSGTTKGLGALECENAVSAVLQVWDLRSSSTHCVLPQLPREKEFYTRLTVFIMWWFSFAPAS